jgi:hypothetical protein
MITRIVTVTFVLTLAGMAAGEVFLPPLCTITGKIVAPPSTPSDSLYRLSKASNTADTVMVIYEAVPACTVWALTPVSSRQFFGITDNSGFYRIDSVPVISGYDSITIVAKKTGYIETSQIVHLSANATVTADITLPKSPVNVRFSGSWKSPGEKTRLFGMDKSRVRSISVYSLDGRMIGKLAGAELAAETYHAVLRSLGTRSGMVIVRVVGEGLLETKKINLQNMR